VGNVCATSYPSNVEAFRLGSSDSNGEKNPERRRNLVKVGNGRAWDLGIKKEGGSLDEFTNDETDDGQHTDTAVSDLGFTVAFHGSTIGIGGKAQRIEESERSDNSGKIFRSVKWILWCGGGNRLLDRDSFGVEGNASTLSGRRRSKGGSRAYQEGKGGARDLHIADICIVPNGFYEKIVVVSVVRRGLWDRLINVSSQGRASKP
jgi:hypothetical protein